MKVTKVQYYRLKALPKYENERVGIEIEVGEGETAEQALGVAKAFVKDALGLGPSKTQIANAKQVLIEAGVLTTG